MMLFATDKSFWGLCVFLWFTSMTMATATPNAAARALAAHLQKRGYLSEKTHVHDGGFLVAQEEIAKGDILLKVPVDLMFDESKPCQVILDVANLSQLENDESNDTKTLLAKHLVESNRKPVTLWSKPAQEILLHIVGHELEPSDWSDSSLLRKCAKSLESQKNDPLPEQALLEKVAALLDSLVYWAPGYELFSHRRGPSHNIDFVSNADDKESFFTLVANKDISTGDSLFVSWTDCHLPDNDAADCPDTPQIFSFLGYVEQGPTKWIWDLVEYDIDDNDNVLFYKDGKEFFLFQTSFLLSHHERLEAMEPEFRKRWESLEDSQEADMLESYYEQLKRGFQLASLEARISAERKDQHSQECDLDMNGDALSGTCNSVARYDDLEVLKPSADLALEELCAHGTVSSTYGSSNAEDFTSSFYQSIRFVQAESHSTQHPDTCLVLEDILQSCTSYRPHYHEFMLHYPISFLKPNQLKRVLVLGGGDIMFVHEIIKYDSLEMLVMLELDQQVPRQAFRNYGIQPGFDNPKVNWWFGDASKTLQMIPEEWYGTFDLVLVDLLTYVVDTVFVSDKENLLDAARRMMHPDGIIVRNEDFDYVKDPSFAKSVVLFQVDDVPVQCHQFNTMGSDSIDFLKQETYDHGVETLLYKYDKDNHYQSWRNYYRQNNELKAEVDETERTLSEGDGANSLSMYQHGGLMIVLEVEEASAALSDSELMLQRIQEAIESSGLALPNSLRLSMQASSQNKSSIIMVGEHGYVKASLWPFLKYCAFDVVLWRKFDAQDQLVKSLVDAVGGRMEDDALSSYRVATGIGLNEEVVNQIREETQTAESMEQREISKSNTTSPGMSNSFGQILRTFVSSLSTEADPLLVLCGDKDIASCKSRDELDETRQKVFPLWQCSDSHATMRNCEEQVKQTMTDFVLQTNTSFGGIVVDRGVSREMGQIILKIFSETHTRNTLLTENFISLSIMPNESYNVSEWIPVLLNRFRTEMVIFEPCYDVDISVPRDGSRIQVFSAGTRDFYTEVKQAVVAIENETGIELLLEGGRAGNSKYQANFEPTKSMLMEDYDLEPSFSQWEDQQPIGLQTNWQFEVRSPPASLKKGDRVLISTSSGHWFGEWKIGTVELVLEGGRYSVIADGTKHPTTRPRAKLLEYKTPLPGQYMKPGEIVVVPYQILYELNRDEEYQGRNNSDLRGTWDQGFVLETSNDGSYKVQIFWDGKEVWVKPEHTGFRYPPQSEEVKVDLTKSQLREILERGIQKQGSRVKGSIAQLSVGMADFGSKGGCIFAAVWTMGTIVVTWDGHKKFDVNLFLEGAAATEGRLSQSEEWENFLLSEIPHLTVSTMAKQPRGYGRVVNTQAELKMHWFGLDQQMQEHDDEDE